MGLFNNLFGNNNETSQSMNWNTLEKIEDLDQALEASKTGPIVLFKHSTRCSISSSALNRLERNWQESETAATPYYLDLISHRDISGSIAEKLGVQHQSPQMIIVENGKAIFNSSHMDINFEDVKSNASAKK